MNRRDFIAQTASIAGAAVAGATGFAKAAPLNIPKGKAEHVIFLWLGGGMAQIDTFDPKRRGNSKATPKVAGSEYDTVDTVVPGVKFCEHLHRTAKLADRLTAMRTINHHLIDEHAFGTNFVHTGRATSGTIVYPSIGSLITHACGPLNDEVPAYVLVGYPNVSRGPGFLGPQAGYVYLTDTKSGPSSFTRDANVDSARQARREKLLAELKSGYVEKNKQRDAIREYDQAIAEALRLSGPNFKRVFELDQEPPDLRNRYGSEFGQRCLLARRLCQAGTRFVEVSQNLNSINGSGWDTHRQGQLKQHLLIQDLDKALATLVLDLEKHRMLDDTLIVVATEFGRPSGWDGGGGRNHHMASFSLVLAGGGLRNGVTIGETNERGEKILDLPISIPDFHATIACAMGVDPAEELYAGERPVPITDHGKPIAKLFS